MEHLTPEIPIDDRQIIQGFMTFTKEALEALIHTLPLHMSVRDLQYCQTQYRLRERRDPTVEELRFLDQLYTSRIKKQETMGLRTLYTSDKMVAQTYADLINKASQIRREQRPYTPVELDRILTRFLEQAGKKMTVPHLGIGEYAHARLLEEQARPVGCALMNNVIAVPASSTSSKQSASAPKLTDHILLLDPAGLPQAAFAQTILSLPISPETQIVSVRDHGLIESLLIWDGVYIVQNYLPHLAPDAPPTELIASQNGCVLLRVDAENSIALRDAATAAGLTASIIGKITLNHRLTVRREGLPPFQLNLDFLKDFSPILPADAEITGICTEAPSTPISSFEQTIVPDGDCPILASAIPGNPYVQAGEFLLSGAVSPDTGNTFRNALYTAIHAVNRAVAAGASYQSITIAKQISTPSLPERNIALGKIMASLLGTYRVQAELAIPNVDSEFISSLSEDVHANVWVAAPNPQKIISHTFQAPGNNVYLLTPLSNPDTLIDFEDYRKMLAYIQHLIQNDVVQSAIAVNVNELKKALTEMTSNGYGFLAQSLPPSHPCGILIETNQIIHGKLLGVTTATPTIHIGENQTPIVKHKAPTLPQECIPMSDIGTAHPIVCIPQTHALGNPKPLENFLQQNRAHTRMSVLTAPTERDQLTTLANNMLEANITLLVGTTEEIRAILQNKRVQYARAQLLSRGGILLLLYTDRSAAKNVPIPNEHPLFFGVPATLYDRDAIALEDEQGYVVHMRANSRAIRQMLLCGIQYFQ